MQTYPEAQFSLRLTEKVPVRKIEIESKVETPNISLTQLRSFLMHSKRRTKLYLNGKTERTWNVQKIFGKTNRRARIAENQRFDKTEIISLRNFSCYCRLG